MLRAYGSTDEVRKYIRKGLHDPSIKEQSGHRDTRIPAGACQAVPGKKSLSVYIGTPFCPTRMPVTAHSHPTRSAYGEIERYLDALEDEIRFAAEAAAIDGFSIESFYIGHGGAASDP